MELIFQFAILIGVIVQCFLMLKQKITTLTSKKIITGLLITLGISIFTSFRAGFENFVLINAILLSFLFITVYRKEIMSFLDERIFIFFNLLLIYFLYTKGTAIIYAIIILITFLMIGTYISMKKYKSNRKISTFTFLLGAIISFIGIILLPIISMINITLPDLFLWALITPTFFILTTIPKKLHSEVFQGVSYLWHLILIFLIEFFVFWQMYTYFAEGNIAPIYLYFFIGSSMVYFMSILFNIILSLPLIGEDTPIQDSMREVYKSMILFSKKYYPTQMSYFSFGLVFIISALIFIIHYFTQIVTFEYLILVLMPVLIFIFRFKNKPLVD